MARHVPTRFAGKLRDVFAEVERASGDEPRHFELSDWVLPGVRLVYAAVDHVPVVLPLWEFDTDIAEICGDGAFPATGGLLAIHRDQARRLRDRGVRVDLSQFVRSESSPGVYYTLFDWVSPEQVHRALHRLVPAYEPHAGVGD